MALRLALALWGLASLSFGSVILAATNARPSVAVLWWLLVTASAGLVICGGLSAAIRGLASLHSTRRRVVLALIVVAAASLQSLVHSSALAALRGPAVPSWGLSESLLLIHLLYLWLFGAFALVVEMYTTVRAAAVLAEKLADCQRRAANARLLAHEAQMRLLCLQLAPDFIFNVLNNISSLIVIGDANAAERSISRLCRFLRAAMSAGQEEMIPLSQELATVDAYLDIEIVRFNDPPLVTVSCPPEFQALQVPPLILHPLIELVVRLARNNVGQSRWIEVRVEPAGETIIVTFTTPQEQKADPIPIIDKALEPVRRRLEGFADQRALLWTHLEKGIFTATVSLTRSASRMGHTV